MKRLLPIFIFLSMAYAVQAQTLVSVFPESQTAVLEEFTGVNCGWCPDGHTIANALEDIYADRFLTVNIHAGGYAVPSAGQPDFRTSEGESLAGAMGADNAGYPSGSVNRSVADGRGTWSGLVESVLTLNSPMNVGCATSFDEASRTITINTETYCTETVNDAQIVVAVLESGVLGAQADYVLNVTHTDYSHDRILREFPTGWQGQDIAEKSTGGLEAKSFQYVVPDTYLIENMDVAVYVIVDGKIVSGKSVKADNGTTLVTGHVNTDDNAYLGMPANTATKNDLVFTNDLDVTESYTITWTNNAPESWNSAVRVNGEDVQNGGSFEVPAGDVANLYIAVSSDDVPGIADVYAQITSNSNPDAPAITHEMHVISGIRDLVVSNPGVAEERAQRYIDGLSAANNSANAKTSIVNFNQFAQANALDGVFNVYMNISWTFPSLTENTAGLLKDFMDNGGNLLIAGQDIGWDQSSGHEAANGTPFTQDFYANYMHAEYVDDGSADNSNFIVFPTDPVFGFIGNSAINDVDSGNLYPEFIAPINGGVAFGRYENELDGQIQTCGIHAETANYKMVYLGIGIEQFADQGTANNFMIAAHNWFYQGVTLPDLTGVETQELNVLGQNFPNPASGITTINVTDLDVNATFHMFDLDGKVVLTKDIESGSTDFTIDVENLPEGIYHYRLVTEKGDQSASFKLMVE